MTEKNTTSRPPVVVVMGHVDHGKTTLIDYIRKTNVAEREAGNITQSIGAYEIEHPSTNSGRAARKITFIDTPGHEAFTKMRSRGANIADLAILVVSATEGPKPQTLETIKILNETKTPFVVAISKIDDSSADVNKVKNQLTEAGVLLEGYGGSVSYQPISSKTGEGINDLLDLIVLLSDVEELTYSPTDPVSGFILEAKINPRRGQEVSVVIKNGTLRLGDEISTVSAKGKVKILEDFQGKSAKEFSPSSPALIIGFEKLPVVGEEFYAGSDKVQLLTPKTQNLQPVSESFSDESAVRIILKASDAGSLEALGSIIKALKSEKKVHVLNESIGDITDGDVKNAIASNAVIVGFKNKVSKPAKNLADIQKVRIITNDIVYHLIKDVEEILTKPEAVAVTGRLEILAIFNQSKLQKQLVGGKVLDGVMKNRANFEIHRLNSGLPAEALPAGQASPAKEGNNEYHLVGHGKIMSLHAGKLEVQQIEAGKECGFVANSSQAIQKGDQVVIK